MIIWVLVDDRIGGNSQSIAIAEKLSNNYIIKNIKYNFFIKFPNLIRRESLIGVDEKTTDDIKNNLPDLVISAGRRLSCVALNIKKRNKGNTFIINLMNPNLNFNKFDILILPKHDNVSKKYLKKGNIIETYGSLNRVNDKKINEESKKWKDFFKNYKRPIVSLIIGGDTKNYKFNPIEFGIMISNLSNIVNKISGTLLITTSRRTSNKCLEQIKQKINCDYYLYDWKSENEKINTSNLGNPYFAFLGLSDFLVITADSISMISEACSTGKPSYIYMPLKQVSKKHYSFCKEMIKQNYSREFNINTEKLEKYNYKPLNELERITDIINKKLEERK